MPTYEFEIEGVPGAWGFDADTEDDAAALAEEFQKKHRGKPLGTIVVEEREGAGLSPRGDKPAQEIRAPEGPGVLSPIAKAATAAGGFFSRTPPVATEGVLPPLDDTAERPALAAPLPPNQPKPSVRTPIRAQERLYEPAAAMPNPEDMRVALERGLQMAQYGNAIGQALQTPPPVERSRFLSPLREQIAQRKRTGRLPSAAALGPEQIAQIAQSQPLPQTSGIPIAEQAREAMYGGPLALGNVAERLFLGAEQAGAPFAKATSGLAGIVARHEHSPFNPKNVGIKNENAQIAVEGIAKAVPDLAVALYSPEMIALRGAEMVLPMLSGAAKAYFGAQGVKGLHEQLVSVLENPEPLTYDQKVESFAGVLANTLMAATPALGLREARAKATKPARELAAMMEAREKVNPDRLREAQQAPPSPEVAPGAPLGSEAARSARPEVDLLRARAAPLDARLAEMAQQESPEGQLEQVRAGAALLDQRLAELAQQKRPVPGGGQAISRPPTPLPPEQPPTPPAPGPSPEPAAEPPAPPPQPPRYAYRVRDVGEEGVPAEGHAQASMNEADVRAYASSRSEKPQEVVRVDLDRLPPDSFEITPRAGGAPWVQFKGGLPEAAVEKVGAITETDLRAGSEKAADMPEAGRIDTVVRAAVADPEGATTQALADATKLPAAQVVKGAQDVIEDKQKEFSPQAQAIKRAVIEGEVGRATEVPVPPPAVAPGAAPTEVVPRETAKAPPAPPQPQPPPAPPAPAGHLGREATVSTADQQFTPKVRYRLVEASEPIVSHEEISDAIVRPNAAYPQELQPRDRTRAASSTGIKERLDKLNPELLGANPLASDGAPIIGPDGVVESGNGRLLSLRRGYRQGHPKMAEYRGWLRENAASLGLDPAAADQMKQPVLVRERVGNVSDRGQWARSANESSLAEMSPAEQARADAESMTPEMLATFNPGDEGQLDTPLNRPFVAKFMEMAGPNRAGRLVDRDGFLSKVGRDAIRNAVVYRAYGDLGILEKLAEDIDPEAKNVLGASVGVAPRLVRLADMAHSGDLHDLPIAPAILDAVKKYGSLKAAGMDVRGYLQQEGLFGSDISPEARAILDVLDLERRSGKRMLGFLQDVADGWEAAGSPKQAGLFETRTPEVLDVIEAAAREQRKRSAGPVQGTLYEAAAGRGDRGGAPAANAADQGAAPGGGEAARGGGEPAGELKPADELVLAEEAETRAARRRKKKPPASEQAPPAERPTRYMREAEPTTQALPHEEQRRHIDRVNRVFRGGLPLELVRSQADLPRHVQELAGESRVDGVRDPKTGRIYIVSENIESPQRLYETIVHESLGHDGFRSFLGPKYTDFLDSVWKTRRADIEAAPWLSDYGFDTGKSFGRQQATDEWVAREVARILRAEVETKAQRPLWVNRFISLAHAGLNRVREALGLRPAPRETVEHLIRDGRWDEEGLRKAAEAVREGKERGIEARGEEAPQFSRRQEETEEFRRWFGDSKVRDESGRPKVVYHGTDSDFTRFDARSLGKNTDSEWENPRLGHWFTDNRDRVSKYGSKTVPVYLSLRNPLVLRPGEHRFGTHPAGLRQTYTNPEVVLERMIRERGGPDGFLRWAERKGYDGIALEDPLEDGTSTHYLAFRPEQIKSATGNRGTFDPTNPDITFSKRPHVTPAPARGDERSERRLRTLVALHNTTEEGILAADRLGGIPVPSIAITKPEIGIERYGPITLVGDKALVDPSRGVPVFESDIHSRTQPLPSRAINKKALDTWVARINAGLWKKGDEWALRLNPERHEPFSAERPERLTEKLAGDHAVMRTWLRNRGEDVDIPYEERGGRRFVRVFALEDAAKEKIGDRWDEYERWVRDEIEPILGPEYLADGRRQRSYTIDNLVDVMTRKGIRAAEGSLFEGLSRQRARGAKKLGSVEAIHRLEDRLISAEDMARAKEDLSERFFRFTDALPDRPGNPFSRLDAASLSLGEILKTTRPTKERLRWALRRNGFENVADAALDEGLRVAEALRGAPTQYFEAKPQRAVRLSEFAGAVVPEGTATAVLDALKRQGVTDIRTYPRGDETARKAAVAAFSDRSDREVLFARRPSDHITPDFGVEGIDEKIREVEKLGLPTPTFWQKTRQRLATTKAAFTRHFLEIDPNRGPEWARTQDALRRHEAIPQAAQSRAVDTLADITRGLDKPRAQTFQRYLAFSDLLRSMEEGLYIDKFGEAKELPFLRQGADEGLGKQSLRSQKAVAQYVDRLKQAIDADPTLKEAVEKRQKAAKDLTQQLVEEELLPPETLEDDRYFHRQVLAAVADELAGREAKLGIRTGSADVRLHRKGFQKERVGSEEEFGLRYAQSEFEWMAQAHSLLMRKKILSEIKDSGIDIGERLTYQVKQHNLVSSYRGEGDPSGEKTYAEVRKLEAERAEILGNEEGLDSSDKARLREISERLDEIDHLRPFKIKMAAMTAMVEREIEKGNLTEEHLGGFDPVEALDTDNTLGLMSRLAKTPEGTPGKLAALGFLKALAGRQKAIVEKSGPLFQRLGDVIPKGYIEWQPKKGSAFYRAVGVSEQLLERIEDAMSQEGFPGADGAESRALFAELMQKANPMLVRGGKLETWVIPEEVARTMDQPAIAREENALGAASAYLLGQWKRWQLFNPVRALKYLTNNQSGDTDIVIATAPGALKYWPAAIKDLYAWARKKPILDSKLKELQRAEEHAVVGSGITVAEIPDIDLTGPLRQIADSNPNVAARGVQAYWGLVMGANNIRENSLRLATYRWAKDQLAAGKKVYGAAERALVDATDDIEKKAAIIARQTLGDYGNVSHAGQWIRRHMMPFYSWVEINAPRYARALANASHEGRGGRATAAIATGRTVSFAVRAGILYSLVQAWNHTMYPQEEEELGQARDQMHIILGRNEDGTIRSMRFQGALSDALSWFGAENFPQDVDEVSSGKATLTDKLADVAKAPAEKIVQGWEPFTKTAAEAITKKSTYPHLFKHGATTKLATRPLRDAGEAVARGIGWPAPELYGAIKGVPKRDKGLMSTALTYDTDPEEAAYHTTRQLVRDYREKVLHKEAGGGGDSTAKGDALYYLRKAVQYKDEDAQKRWMTEYVKEGGTTKGFRQSVKAAHPLAGIPVAGRRAFLSSLTDPADKRAVEKALLWHTKGEAALRNAWEGGYRLRQMAEAAERKEHGSDSKFLRASLR